MSTVTKKKKTKKTRAPRRAPQAKYVVETDVPPPASADDLDERRRAIALKVAELKITRGILAKDIAEAADMTKSMFSLTLSGGKSRTLEDKLDRIERAIEELTRR